MSTRMSGADTAWLRMERPTNPMVITGVLVFRTRLDPARVRVRRYDVTIEGQQLGAADALPDDGLARGPYLAETYPVAVEQRHVVVDVPALEHRNDNGSRLKLVDDRAQSFGGLL